MKRSYINIGRILAFLLCVIVVASALCVSSFAMGLGMGENRNTRNGMDNNTPENGIVDSKDLGDGNLGDKDGDGRVEDEGNGNGIIGDIGDMGSEIISDIGDAGSEIVSDIGDGAGIGDRPNSSNSPSESRAPTASDSGTANENNKGGGGIWGIVIAVVIALALVISIIVLIPKSKNKH